MDYFRYLFAPLSKENKIKLGSYLLALHKILSTIFPKEFLITLNGTAAFGFNNGWYRRILNFRNLLINHFSYTSSNNVDCFNRVTYDSNSKSINQLNPTQRGYIDTIYFPLKIKTLVQSILNGIEGILEEKDYKGLLKLLKFDYIFNEETRIDDLYLNSINHNSVFSLNEDFEYINNVVIWKNVYSRKPKSFQLDPVFISILNLIDDDTNQSELNILKSNYKLIDDLTGEKLKEFIKSWEDPNERISFRKIFQDITESGEVNININQFVDYFMKNWNINSDYKSVILKKGASISHDKYQSTINGITKIIADGIKNEDNSVISSAKNNNPTIPTTTSPKPRKIPVNLSENVVIGYDDIKEWIASHIEQSLNPEMRKHLKLNNPDGILLYGLPGCGKTNFAKWIANKVGLLFNEIPRSLFGSPYVDGAMLNLINKINELKLAAPGVIFFDEFESVGMKRQIGGSSGSSENKKVVDTLLQEIPKLIDLGNIIIAATNFIDDLDDAIIRTGRFGPKIPIFPPLPFERSVLFSSTLINYVVPESPIHDFLVNNEADKPEFWKNYADKMLLFSNSDVISLAEETAKELYKIFTTGQLDLKYLTLDDKINKIKINCPQFSKFHDEIILYNKEMFKARLDNLHDELQLKCPNNNKSNGTGIGFKKDL